MLAIVSDYGIGQTKTGIYQITIKFQCEDGKFRNWYGYLTDKAMDITLDSIIRCGFKGDDPGELAGGLSTGLLDTKKQVDLAVEEETYEGKTREKVKWINEVGGGGFKNLVSKEDAVKAFKGANLRAALAERRKLNPPKMAPIEDDEPVF